MRCTVKPGPPPMLKTNCGPPKPPSVLKSVARPVREQGADLRMPNGPPPKPPPPPKNRLNNSSGEISSSNIGPRPGDLAKPLNGDAPGPLLPPAPDLLSGSPPNWSYLALFSASDKTWNALETTATCQFHVHSSLCENRKPHTLERLVRPIVAILIRMRQQTDLAISLFDLAIATRLGDRQDLVEGRGIAFPYPNHLGLLLRCEGLFLIALIVVAVARGSIGLRRRPRGAGGHAAGGPEGCGMTSRAIWRNGATGTTSMRRDSEVEMCDGGTSETDFVGSSEPASLHIGGYFSAAHPHPRAAPRPLSWQPRASSDVQAR